MWFVPGLATHTDRQAELLAGHRGCFFQGGRGGEGDGGGVSQLVVWGGCPETGILTRFRASSRTRSSLGKLSDPLVGKLPMREYLSE